MSAISMHAESDRRRAAQVVRRMIGEFRLDLKGLTVLTEAASGAYLYTPILAALAGAQRVYAVARDSRFGAKEEIAAATQAEAQHLGMAERLEVVFTKDRETVSRADIVTNTGNLRPIDAAMVGWMKPTAAIPLMWEPWELRPGEIDLEACRTHGIPVMGTDETRAPNDLFKVPGLLALKMLFELGLEGYKTRVLLLGGGKLGRAIRDDLSHHGAVVSWFARSEKDAQSYEALSAFWDQHGTGVDALIVAEHGDPALLIGAGGLLDASQLHAGNPDLRIGCFAGNIAPGHIRAAGLTVFPADISPYGHMSYQSYHLGILPVLQLYAAGLKVGEALARARLAGKSLAEAKRDAAKHSPAIDF